MIKPYKGYENHLASFLAKTEKSEEEVKAAQAQSKELLSYTLPEGMMMEDITIDGPDEGQKWCFGFTDRKDSQKKPL